MYSQNHLNTSEDENREDDNKEEVEQHLLYEEIYNSLGVNLNNSEIWDENLKTFKTFCSTNDIVVQKILQKKH